jgi:hypothetical protein
MPAREALVEELRRHALIVGEVTLTIHHTAAAASHVRLPVLTTPPAR